MKIKRLAMYSIPDFDVKSALEGAPLDVSRIFFSLGNNLACIKDQKEISDKPTHFFHWASIFSYDISNIRRGWCP
jgi:hypothetical protein